MQTSFGWLSFGPPCISHLPHTLCTPVQLVHRSVLLISGEITNYYIPHYAIFSSLPSLHPSYVKCYETKRNRFSPFVTHRQTFWQSISFPVSRYLPSSGVFLSAFSLNSGLTFHHTQSSDPNSRLQQVAHCTLRTAITAPLLADWTNSCSNGSHARCQHAASLEFWACRWHSWCSQN
jgi:hypothetical protein